MNNRAVSKTIAIKVPRSVAETFDNWGQCRSLLEIFMAHIAA